MSNWIKERATAAGDLEKYCEALEVREAYLLNEMSRLAQGHWIRDPFINQKDDWGIGMKALAASALRHVAAMERPRKPSMYWAIRR
jgi:hypothetical protein